MTGEADHTDQEQIASVYDEHAEYEYLRLTKSPVHRLEYELTCRILDRIVRAGDLVLEVGSGPGRYTEWLLRRGTTVGAVDLSPQALEMLTGRLDADLRQRLEFARVGTATDLFWVDEAAYDSVLMMGPLYHLTTRAERLQAIAGGLRALKPGGSLVTAHVSPYAAIRNAVASGDTETALRIMSGGVKWYLGMQMYVQWPADAAAELEASGCEQVECHNMEGVFSTLDPNLLETVDSAVLADIAESMSRLPDTLGTTIHYLCVGRKPGG